MPPGGNKRKRSERQDEGSGRPSPHRPDNLGLAQQNGGSRGGRSGGGSRQSRQSAASPRASANATPLSQRNVASPGPATTGVASVKRDTHLVDGSRPATPSQPTPQGSQLPVSDTPQPPPAPYWYEYITDERVQAWQDQGKDELLDAVKDGDEMAISTIIQELIRSALDRRLDAAEAGSLIGQMISQHSTSETADVQSLFLNTISLMEDSDTKNSNLLALIAATDIDPEVIRLELDIPLLQTLSLVRTTFTQMRTRKTTNILYRQANFNLLREESEGYAKLITEYFSVANEAVKHEVNAENAFQRIKALVGSFDLDVGRVLDITLDISANLLVRAWDFIVQFYRCSSWWPDGGMLDNVKWQGQGFSAFPRWALPDSERAKLNPEDELDRRRAEKEELKALKHTRDVHFWERVKDVGMDAFYEIGARKIIDLEEARPLLETEVPPEYDARGKEINADRRKRINENRKYMRETGFLPPQGNSDAAQLLGFKLRFYASQARDSQDVLPENLIYLAALLIKIGFISLRDLYPHLYPTDDKMLEEKARLEREKAEREAKDRPGGGTNALAMAGALTDDTLPVMRNLRAEKERSGGSTPKLDKKDEESKEELPAPSNQKILLLRALLAIGALPEALYILGRFPWLVDVEPSLPAYLQRIARQMLSKVADMLRPLRDREAMHDPRDEPRDTALELDDSVHFRPREPKPPTKWLGIDQADKTDGHKYRHYYLEWEDSIPLCQNVEDVVLLCNSFLGYLGMKIGQDAVVLGTLVRVAKFSLAEDDSESNSTRWLDLMRRLLVPALSLSKHNPGLTQEVYELLKFFPTMTRYNIYAEWFTGRTSRLPDMRVAFDYNRAEVKDVLRRVTNETGKKQARALAKVAYSSPGIVMMSMINQLESYSNMIPSLVECTKYFSPLAYDVLSWCLINSLSGQGRDRMQADGMLTSPWLQASSQFVASLFFKYPAVNPTPVLQYLASELRAGNSTDLEMFEQVLAEMAGIRSDMEFNDAQVLAMAGGELLQAQTVQQVGDKRHTPERKRAVPRLIKSLEEKGLIGQMVVAIAQERQMYSHHESSKFMPLKVLGNNLDKIQQVFAQYLDVLKTNLKPAEFEASVPDVTRLVADFGLEPGMAFTICRTAILHRMNEKRRSSQEVPPTNGDVDMEGSEAKPVANGDHSAGENADGQEATESVEATTPNDDSKATSSSPATNGVVQPWHPVLQPIIENLAKASSQLAEKVSIPFFVTFWTLALQDVTVSTTSYTIEIDRISTEIREIQMDRSNMTSDKIREREKKRKGLAELQKKLNEEVKGRVALYQKTRNRLSYQEKGRWFDRSMDKDEIDARHLGLLQECFLPRSMLSSLDAHYCFLMLKMLHDKGTPGFSTMHLLNQLMRKHELAAIMFQCTAMEAQHFGRFLCETLRLLQHWHADKAKYEKEALGSAQKLPGFAKKLDSKGVPETFLEFEDYRRLLYNWHSFLNGALQMCFESGEYMHIRNGIIVLKSIVQVFPSLNFMGHNMVKQVTKLSEEDSRQDLKLAAMSLLGPLRNREKQWMMPQAFRLNDPSKETVKTGSRAPSAIPETPQPSSVGTPKLNATASEFKPGPSDVAARKESIAGKEDGEIEDEKQVTAKVEDEVMKDVPDSKPETNSATEEVTEKTDDVNNTRELTKTIASEQPSETQKPASRPSTPAATTTKAPASAERSWPDSSRPPSTQPTRPPHELPSRPENRPTSRPLPVPPSDRGGNRYPSRPDDKYGRLDRPNDLRPASRDHSPGGRSRARTPERDSYYGQTGSARGPTRDERGTPRAAAPPPDYRSSRDDAHVNSRRDQPPQPGLHSRPSYDSRERGGGGMGPPPASHSSHTDRGSYINSAVVNAPAQQHTRPAPPANPANQANQPPQSSQTQHNENPARLALINEDQSQGRERSKDAPGWQRDSRNQRETRDDRVPVDSRAAQPDSGATDGRVGPPESPREGPGHARQPSDLAPTGPRRGRQSRDLTTQATPESSYGRLNGPQEGATGPPAGPPTGPRPPNGPSGRPTRSFGHPQVPTAAGPIDPPQPSLSATRPLESPAAFRGSSQRQQPDRRGSGQQFERQPSSNSVPTTPIGENGPMVHPSRMAQLGVQPPPIQTNVNANGPRNVASPTSAPPSGPRGSNRPPVGTPTGPSPNGAPSGPASAVERQKRGDRQRADINATLQGTTNNAVPNGQGVSFRGAAQNRQSSMTSASFNAQPVQALVSPLEPSPRRNEPDAPARQEQPLTALDARPDLTQMKSGRNEDDIRGPSRPRRREDETDRQRGSGNPNRGSRPEDDLLQRPPPPAMEDRRDRRNLMREDRGPRDERDGYSGPPRDTRGTERPPRANDVPPRRPPPQDGPGAFPGPPPDWERPNDRRGPRRDGPGGGRGGGGRPEDFRGGRREDERRAGPRDDGPPPPQLPQSGGRKRRHEDGPGAFDETKRRRSGR